MFLALADKYGQIVGDINEEAKITIRVDATFNEGKADSLKYFPVLEGETQFTASNGVFLIKDITFAASPGHDYKLLIETDYIDSKIPSNAAYMKEAGLNVINFPIDIGLRECEIGEEFTDAGKCLECAAGETFSLVKYTEPTPCTACPGD